MLPRPSPHALAAATPRSRALGGLLVALLVSVAQPPTARGETWTVVDRARTRSMPWSVTPSPDGGALFVSHVGLRGHDNVYRLDAATLEVEARANFAGHAVESVLAKGKLYVSNSREHVVVVLDARDLSVIERIPTGRVPKAIALSPDGETLYTADWRDGAVSVIDLESKRSTQVATGRRTRGVTVSQDGRTVYAAVFGAGQVAVIDASERAVVKRVDACAKPRHVVVTPDDEHLLVTCHGSQEVVVVSRSSHEIAHRVPVGPGPKTVALAPDGAFAVTANEDGDTVTFIDLETFAPRTQKVPVDKPCGAAVGPEGQRVYITGRGSHDMVVLRPR